MGSMSDAVNAPEAKPEVGETSTPGAASVEGTPSGHLAQPEPMSPAIAKSPTELHEDKADEANEPPEKKARMSMEEEMRLLMQRVREGFNFNLTSAALDKVQQHLDISRQNSKDLAQLAQDVHQAKVSAKYSLAQLQAMLNCFQNIEWQTSGSKGEANTSLKAVSRMVLVCLPLLLQRLRFPQRSLKGLHRRIQYLQGLHL